MLAHDAGVLCAPTAFGKTVVAAAIIARRGVNTLILVHRTELLRQWQERLRAFLSAGKELVGNVGGGKAKPTGRIDIAVMQSLSRRGEVDPMVEGYGQIIVDEWRIFLTKPRKFLLYILKLLIGHVIELHETCSRAFNTTKQFIKLERHNACFSILRVLNQEHHEKCNNCSTSIDDELPGV